jgi:bifunctional non-homologous end joining protein LigD
VKPPSGADWVHEIKHDGYRLIVRRDGPTVRLHSRNAYDWTARLSAIATAAQRIKAKSFTIDGEAVVLGPDGLSRFVKLSRREAARDLIEHDGEDLRNLPFLDRKSALAWLLRETEAGILLNEHIADDRATVFAHCVPAWRRGHRFEEGRWHLPVRPLPRLDQGQQPAPPCSASGARFGIDEPRAVCAGDGPPQGET